jgi:hypothetical protein
LIITMIAHGRARRNGRGSALSVGLGALLVGYFERDDFVFAGNVATGFRHR